MKLKDVDLEKLPGMIIKLPLISKKLHHKKVQYSVKDYLLPTPDSPELEFIYDLFTLETDEIIDKWYNGEKEAMQLLEKLTK